MESVKSSLAIFSAQANRLLDFHAAKTEYKSNGKLLPGYKQAEVERGFVTSGLWGYSRHPNFACEQSIWFLLYQWSCFASKNLYSWLAVGPA